MTDTMTTPDKTAEKGGPPAGNKNATRHGLRASNLPPGCSYLEGQLTAFRRYVRTELVARDGATSTYQEAVLQSCVRHETRALLASRWLRKELDLRIDQRISLLREISHATDSRDKCLRLLGLDRGDCENVLDALFAPDDPADTPPTPAVTASEGDEAV